MESIEITKKEVKKSEVIKKIKSNILIYLLIYIVIFAIIFPLMYFLIMSPTLGLIFLTITGILFLLFEIYNIYRYFYILSYNKFERYIFKVKKINYYMNKIPVFAFDIKIDNKLKEVETDAIYRLKDIDKYQDKNVKALYDKKKDRIYIISII